MTDDASHRASDRELDQAIDDVYRGPLEEFVGRRDTLVKELRAAGRRVEANEVKSLRRPSRTAWALNTAAVEDPVAVEGLAAALADAIEAQSGGGDLREAFDQMRTAVRDVAAAAAQAAASAGHPVDQASLVPAVSAVAADTDALDALRSGRLATIPTSGGLDLLTNLPQVTLAPSKAPRTRKPSRQPARHHEPLTAAKGAGPVEGEAKVPGLAETDVTEVETATTATEDDAVQESLAQQEAAAAAREALLDAEATSQVARERATAAERALRRAEAGAEVAEEQLRLAERTAQAKRKDLHRAREDARAAEARQREAEEAVAEAQAAADRLA